MCASMNKLISQKTKRSISKMRRAIEWTHAVTSCHYNFTCSAHSKKSYMLLTFCRPHLMVFSVTARYLNFDSWISCFRQILLKSLTLVYSKSTIRKENIVRERKLQSFLSFAWKWCNSIAWNKRQLNHTFEYKKRK